MILEGNPSAPVVLQLLRAHGQGLFSGGFQLTHIQIWI